MELEELKTIWSSLDERMRKQEGLNVIIIKEMLVNKSNRGLSKLINYTYFGIIGSLIGIPLVIWRMNSLYFGIFKTTIFFLGIVLFFYGVITGVYNLKKLLKIDFAKPIGDNIILVQQYKLSIKKQLIAIYTYVGILLFLVVIVFLIDLNKIEPWRWAVIVAVICICFGGAWWEYKRMYRKNIDSILKSLDELKELEE